MEDEACAFVASMIERIVNAEVEKEELSSLSTLLLVLVPKADRRRGKTGRHFKYYSAHSKSVRSLFRRRCVHDRIFDEEKLQHGAAPAGPERIIHTVKAAFTIDNEDTAVLCSGRHFKCL